MPTIIMKKEWVIENVVAIPLAVAVASVIAYWAMVIDRRPPILLSGGVLIPAAVRPGEIVTSRWNIEPVRASSCSATITREIIDSIDDVQRKADQETGSALAPTTRTISRDTQVSFKAAWGPARYRLTHCFRCDGISLTQIFPVCRTWPDLSFTVMKPLAE